MGCGGLCKGRGGNQSRVEISHIFLRITGHREILAGCGGEKRWEFPGFMCRLIGHPRAPGQSFTVLWYQNPAEQWIDALPVGNGRLGAMVFGRPNEERIQFNEETRWSGGPYDPVVAGGAEHLAEIQQLIFAGDFRKTHKLRITADEPGSISFDAQLRGIRNTSHSNYGNDVFTMDGLGADRLILRGKSADHLGIEGKLRYEAQLMARADGGVLKVVDDHLMVTGADHATLYLAECAEPLFRMVGRETGTSRHPFHEWYASPP